MFLHLGEEAPLEFQTSLQATAISLMTSCGGCAFPLSAQEKSAQGKRGRRSKEGERVAEGERSGSIVGELRPSLKSPPARVTMATSG